MIKNETLILKYNIDTNGNPISIKVDNEQKQVSINGTIQMEFIPDEFNNIVVLDDKNKQMYEVFNRDEITTNTYYVDYNNGVMYFDKSQFGKVKIYNYYSRGLQLIGASRIYDEKSTNGETLIKTLQDIIDEGRKCLELISTLGDAVIIINKLEENILTGQVLHENLVDDITIGTPLQQSLRTDINEANTFKDQFHQDVVDGKALSSELRQNIVDGADINTELQTTMTNAQADIDKINATGNKSITVGSSQFVNGEYTWIHNVNSEDIIVNVIDSITNEPLVPDYKIIDKNTILLRNSTEHPNIKVMISASYYNGNSLLGTTVEEFAGDTVGSENSYARLKDDVTGYKYPVTKTDAVYTPDGSKKLSDEINRIDSQLEDNTNKIGILYNNVIHVKEFGNDKQAIINAIAVAQDGDRVEISKGEYLIDSPIQVNKKISIGGKGKLRLNAHGIYALMITADGVEVDGLNIINPHSYKNIDGAKSGGIMVTANNVTITRCHLDGLLHPVMVEADGEYKGVIISNNIITNCIGAGREDMGDGICVFGSEATIVGNYITCKPGEDARIGINFEGLPSYRTDGGNDDGTGTIMGNVIKGSFRRAIHVEGVDNTTVVGNVCKGTTWWGIFVYSDCVTVTGNSVMMPTTPITVGLEWSPVISGIHVYRGEGIVVSSNIIKAGGAGGQAIYIRSQAKGSIVNGNQIVGDAQSLDAGINVDESNDHIISNNKVKNRICKSYGFYAYNSQRLKVTNNYIEGCQRDGFYFEGSHNCSIKGNTTINNVGAGLKIINSNDCIVEGNYCSDNQTTKTQDYGIYTWNCDDLILYGNDVTGNINDGISLQGGSDNPIVYGNNGFGYRVYYNTAPPTSGTFQIGDKVYNTSPFAGGYEGWVCVASGSPGTWKGFGLIQS